jgi:hypothetical protein
MGLIKHFSDSDAGTFVIKRVDFDSWENHNPHIETFEGYVGSRAEAEAWVEKRMAATKQTKGWDGGMYPHWTITPLRQL